MSEIQLAMQIIAKTDKKRGIQKMVAHELGATCGSVSHWFTRGFGGDVAVTLWKASGKQVDLTKLVEEGEALKSAAQSQAKKNPNTWGVFG